MTMKWFPVLSLLLTGLFVTGVSLQALSEDQNESAAVTTVKKKIYFSDTDFPPDGLLQHPQPAVKRTEFLQLLDKAARETEKFQLTESLDGADYRVELRCGGIVFCNRLNIYILTPNRDVLTSYVLPGKPYFGKTNLAAISKQLADTIASKITAIENGGVGDYGLIHPATTP